MTAIQIAQFLLALAPDIFQTVESAIPTAESLINSIMNPNSAVSTDQFTAIHAQITTDRAAFAAAVAAGTLPATGATT